MNWHESNFKRKCILIFSTSLILEVFQYILTVGGTGITGLITNTCGGMTGIGLYWSAVKIFRGKKADTVITVTAFIVTVIAVGGVSGLLISNGWRWPL